MDALKRAEKARQAQAEKADASEGESESGASQELSLDPLDPSQFQDQEAIAAAATPPAADVDFALQADAPIPPAAATEDVADDRPEAQPESEDGAVSMSMDFGDLSLDDTSATLPSMKSAQRSVDDYFDGTHSMSMSMEKVRTAMEEGEEQAGPATDPLPGTRSDATTKQTARAVFNAKTRPPSGSSRVVSLVVVPLLVLALIIGAGFVYWDQLLKYVDTSPSLVVKRPPPPPAPATNSVAQAPESGQAASTTTMAANTLPATPQSPQPNTQPEPSPAPADSSTSLSGTLVAGNPLPTAGEATTDTAATTTKVPSESGQEAASAAATGESQDAGDNLQAMADQALREATENVPVDLQAQLRKHNAAAGASSDPLSLRITHHRRADRVHKDLMQAYEAFQKGANDRAMAAYRKALKRRPEDRDALLGVAALEVRAGNLQRATTIYYRLLASNPRDPMVQSALISLREDVDPVAGESTIKNLLQTHPESANLHFNLGNLFARQLRWSEAQQAYFDAYRLDVGNPDYAYNLAISLDHLAKPRAAMQFYQLAVELADAKPASFPQADALQRIGLLSAAQ